MKNRSFGVMAFVMVMGLGIQAQNPSYAGKYQPDWCRMVKAPIVNVVSETEDIKWDFSKSQADLKSLEIDTVNPYGQNVITDVGGLMQGGIEMSETMRFNTLTNPNTNEFCMFFTQVDVKFKISPTIYIASEHKPDTCMHNSIKNHELKHINIDRQIVNKYSAAVGNSIKRELEVVGVYGPYKIGMEDRVKKFISSRLENILIKHSAKMDVERRQRQQGIDNVQEYDAVQRACK